MANITEVSQWENVIRQIENGEAATGGADGLANVQAKQLANRTKWLKDKYEGTAIVSKLAGKWNGYIKYDSGLIIQWGRTPASQLELNESQYIYKGPFHISFQYDYPAIIAISGSHYGGSVYGGPTICLTYGSATHFFVKVNDASKVNLGEYVIEWVAIGY